MSVFPIYGLWASVILSLALSVFGLVKSKVWALTAGAILFLPFVYYFSGYPAARTTLVLPLLHFGAAFALYKKNRTMAWLLFSPVMAFMALVFGIVFVNVLRS